MEPRPLLMLLPILSSSVNIINIDFVSLYYFLSLWKRDSLSKPRKAGAGSEDLECQSQMHKCMHCLSASASKATAQVNSAHVHG